MIRKECDTCLSWDVPKDMCLRVSHGMACVVGELPPGVWAKIPARDWPPLVKVPLGALRRPDEQFGSREWAINKGSGLPTEAAPPPMAAGAADNAIYKRIADNYDAITEAPWQGTPLPRANIPGPDFHCWRQDSLANFAAEVYAEYKALKVKLAKIEAVLK